MADKLRAADIDIDDRDQAQQVRALTLEILGDTLVRRRANSGRCLLPYRAAHGTPKKRALVGKHGKMEILGFGQQFVAHGRHPSGAELYWTPVPPERMPGDNLPSVTEEQVTAFLEAAVPLIETASAEDQHNGNGAARPVSAFSDEMVPVDAAALLDLIAEGRSSHDAMVCLAGRWAGVACRTMT